jgi:hypothetical protein
MSNSKHPSDSNRKIRLYLFGLICIVSLLGAVGVFINLGGIGTSAYPTDSNRKNTQLNREVVESAPAATTKEKDDFTRINAHVLKNPFGALNLSASTDKQATSVSVNAKQSKAVRHKLAPNPETLSEVGNTLPVTPSPPVPTAPKLPYKAIGLIQGGRFADGRLVVFLSSLDGRTNLAVRKGDFIDSTYQVESVSDSEISLIYLPLKTVQSLNIPK